MTLPLDAVRTPRGSGMNARTFLVSVGLAAVIPAILALLVAIGYDSSAWADGLLWVLYMAASAAVAAILGLIFGVPRARTEFSAESTERYSSNSNLEQISDWLTKLLVGAGLVSVGKLPGLFKGVGDYLGSGMAIPNGPAFSVAALAYGSGTGFATGYLWTRLRLRLLLESSDSAAADASRKRDQIVSALQEVERSSDRPASRRDLQRVAETAVRASKSSSEKLLPVLWVDDNPSNNTLIAESLNAIGIRVDLSLSTDDAIHKLGQTRYGLVITDLGRWEGGRENTMAGLDLVHAIRESDRDIPILVFAGRRGLANETVLREAGANLVTTSGAELYSTAVRLITGGAAR